MEETFTYMELEQLANTYKLDIYNIQQEAQVAKHKLNESEFAVESKDKELAELTDLLYSYRELTEELITKYRHFLQKEEPDWLADITQHNGQVSLL